MERSKNSEVYMALIVGGMELREKNRPSKICLGFSSKLHVFSKWRFQTLIKLASPVFLSSIESQAKSATH
jgi:hypothetical protein